MHKLARVLILALLGSTLVPSAAPAQDYTPTEYVVTLYEVAISTNGTDWIVVLDEPTGTPVDIADPASFASAFASGVPVAAGVYKWVRMTISEDLVWSYPSAPVSLSNQTFTVSGGPPGPVSGQMAVHFATYDQGGLAGGDGGGQGTVGAPFLLGTDAKVAANATTTLRLVFAVTESLQDQGGSVYDLAPPEMFFVSENIAPSTLSGTFNTTVFNAIKEVDGTTIERWEYVSGYGVLTFDGSGGWTWSGVTNDFDLNGGASGALNNSATFQGTYGVNNDGSFWMITRGESGTLRGAISSDDSMLVATMFDSPTSHMMIFGVEQATSASTAILDNDYYFTLYGQAYNSGPTQLEFDASFGIMNGTAGGAVSGNQDGNRVLIQNPTSGSPSFTAPASRFADPFTENFSVAANGVVNSTNSEIAGGILENGDAACMGSNFHSTYAPENKFAFMVRQSAANTFNTGSLFGTYFGGHFGDSYDNSGPDVEYYSGYFTVVFDGIGGAIITTVENTEGVINVSTFTQEYTVNPTTGIVQFYDVGDSPGSGDIFGAIGPNAMSFILASEQDDGGSANDQRFLGLGLKQ